MEQSRYQNLAPLITPFPFFPTQGGQLCWLRDILKQMNFIAKTSDNSLKHQGEQREIV